MASISSMDCYLLLGDIQRPKRALSVSLSSCLSVCWSVWEETGGRVLQRCLRHCSPCSQLHGMGLCTCSLMAALALTIQRGSKRIVCHFLRAQVGEGFEVKCAGDLMGKDCPGLRYEAISFWQYCTCSYFSHRGHPVRLVNTPRPLDVRNFRMHCHLCQRFRCSFYLISIHRVSM